MRRELQLVTTAEVFAAHETAYTQDSSTDSTVPADAEQRVEGLLGAARSAAGYVSEEDSTLTYAATLLRSISAGHAFVDGNKKTAWTICALALKRNGYELSVTDQNVCDFCVRVLVEKLPVETIATQLAEWLVVDEAEI